MTTDKSISSEWVNRMASLEAKDGDPDITAGLADAPSQAAAGEREELASLLRAWPVPTIEGRTDKGVKIGFGLTEIDAKSWAIRILSAGFRRATEARTRGTIEACAECGLFAAQAVDECGLTEFARKLRACPLRPTPQQEGGESKQPLSQADFHNAFGRWSQGYGKPAISLTHQIELATIAYNVAVGCDPFPVTTEARPQRTGEDG